MQASPDNSIPQELQCDFAKNSQHIAQAMLAIANIYEAVVFAVVFQINCLVFLEGGGGVKSVLFSFKNSGRFTFSSSLQFWAMNFRSQLKSC